VRADIEVIDEPTHPPQWGRRKLAAISSFITKGSTPTTYGFRWESSGVLFLRSECVSEHGLEFAQSMFISQRAHAALQRSQVSSGDLLITITGNVGRVVIYQGEEQANINQHIARVRVTAPDADTLFIYYWLSQVSVRRHFEGITTGQAYPQISLRQVREAEVPLPPLPEQRAIAEALSDVDALLDGLDQLIAKKRDLKQAAVQELLSGRTRLPGFDGAWQTRRLGDHVRFLRNGVNSRAELVADGVVKYLHYGDIHTSEKNRLDVSAEVMPYLPPDRASGLDRLVDGDVVFADASEDLTGVGKSVEVTGTAGVWAVAGLHTIAARFDKFVIADGYKALLQFCAPFREQLLRLAAGTKVFATTRTHIASIELPLPNLEEQTAIAAVLSDMDAELAALEARREKTRALKQGVMQELLTGRTRLV
jgi:type I restriction enzyme, S subunit